MADGKIVVRESFELSEGRPNCPFYGFSAAMGMLMDTSGNQCALVTGSHSPCRMEMGRETPDWNNCQYNTAESCAKIDEYAGDMRVFPDKLRACW